MVQITPYFCVRSNPGSYILSSREEYDRVPTYLYSKRPGIYGVRNQGMGVVFTINSKNIQDNLLLQ